MGQHQIIMCHDCMESMDVDKLSFPTRELERTDPSDYGPEFFDDWYTQYWTMALLLFVDEHSGHDITLAGEYGEPHLWMHQEYDYQRNPFDLETFKPDEDQDE